MNKTATPSNAELAKATLKRLALSRLEPTPQNYARAWREEGGAEPSEPLIGVAKMALETLAARLLPVGDDRQELIQALHTERWQDLQRLVDHKVPSSAAQGAAWADLVDQTVRQMERGSRLWPMGRKKESLNHVLTSSRGDLQRLQQRLRQLLASWSDPSAESTDSPVEADAPVEGAAQACAAVDEAVAQLTSDSPLEPASPDGGASTESGLGVAAGETGQVSGTAADLGADTWSEVVRTLQDTVCDALPHDDPRAQEVGQRFQAVAAGWMSQPALRGDLAELESTCEEVRRVLQLRHHLVAQVTGLVTELTDGLGELSEDDSWVEGQCLAMRDHMALGLTPRSISAVSDLLRSTRLRQQQLRQERAEAQQALKQLIHQMLQDLGSLGEHTGRFSDSVGRYAQVIGQADSLEGLAGVVREMVEETRTVHGLVSQTTERLHAEHARASALSERIQTLEGELRRLSQEVSTDQLTQIANRRGLLTHFEVEKARVERGEIQLSIGILDIDNFKKLNDTMGHQTGDEALKFLSSQVTEALRPSDTLARYGGEEFVVLLRDTEVAEAQTVLTRVQRHLSSSLFMYEGNQTFVTFSAGVTLYRPGEALESALQRADEGLYEAKRAGKNRTCIS